MVLYSAFAAPIALNLYLRTYIRKNNVPQGAALILFKSDRYKSNEVK